ncbi:MAG: hypothetical protein PHO02_04720 [Candidatus Nanoarchaeia archaeon]|nr:hypothetical protein [Candidatus Nanoarchaeia archaeon]
MARKKSKSFGKHIYALIAIVVLLVAAGVASYATTYTPGMAAHAKLYSDEIWGKSGNEIIVKDNLKLDGMAAAGPALLDVTASEVAGARNAIKAYIDSTYTAIEGSSRRGIGVKGIVESLGAGVEGTNTGASTTGKLGTTNAGVEGTVDSATGFGVYGTQAAGGYAIKGLNTDSGNYGEIGGVTTGVKGYGSSYGVQGSTGLSGMAGVDGFTSNPAGYAGKFSGGKGLYASKIEFGSAAFGNTNGYLVLGALNPVSCKSACETHGGPTFTCRFAYLVDGVPAGCTDTSTLKPRHCWCS